MPDKHSKPYVKKKNNQDYKMPPPEQTKAQALGVKEEFYKQPSAGKDDHREQDEFGRCHLRQWENPTSNI